MVISNYGLHTNRGLHETNIVTEFQMQFYDKLDQVGIKTLNI